MGSQYRTILEERKAFRTSRQQLENLNNKDAQDRPIWDTGLENILFGLQGRTISITTTTKIVYGQVDDIHGQGYKIAFEINGELYPLFSNDNMVYNIMDKATHDSVYDNEHIGEPIVNQIAYSLGIKYAEEYVDNQEREECTNNQNQEEVFEK